MELYCTWSDEEMKKTFICARRYNFTTFLLTTNCVCFNIIILFFFVVSLHFLLFHSPTPKPFFSFFILFLLQIFDPFMYRVWCCCFSLLFLHNHKRRIKKAHLHSRIFQEGRQKSFWKTMRYDMRVLDFVFSFGWYVWLPFLLQMHYFFFFSLVFINVNI